jgi:hypothetical protein
MRYKTAPCRYTDTRRIIIDGRPTRPQHRTRPALADLAARNLAEEPRRREPSVRQLRQETNVVITQKHLSRRTVLRGLGVSMALPLLDSMVPARTLLRKTAAAPTTRLAAIEMVHGAAGSTLIGKDRHYWSPAGEGAGFAFTQTLKSLEPLREYVTIISNTDLLMRRPARPSKMATWRTMPAHRRCS